MAAVVSVDATATLTQSNLKIRFMPISFSVGGTSCHIIRAADHERPMPALIGGSLSWPSLRWNQGKDGVAKQRVVGAGSPPSMVVRRRRDRPPVLLKTKAKARWKEAEMGIAQTRDQGHARRRRSPLKCAREAVD
jgi:hypothetical protein